MEGLEVNNVHLVVFDVGVLDYLFDHPDKGDDLDDDLRQKIEDLIAFSSEDEPKEETEEEKGPLEVAPIVALPCVAEFLHTRFKSCLEHNGPGPFETYDELHSWVIENFNPGWPTYEELRAFGAQRVGNIPPFDKLWTAVCASRLKAYIACLEPAAAEYELLGAGAFLIVLDPNHVKPLDP